jgi:hypothetical protein
MNFLAADDRVQTTACVSTLRRYVADLRRVFTAQKAALKAKKIASASCHQTKLIAKPIPNSTAAPPLSQVAMWDS